jgi:uncharacterized protein (TIGR02594 family)
VIERRQFLIQGLLASVGPAFVSSIPAMQPRQNEKRDYYSAFIPQLQALGTNSPKPPELAKADELLLASPNGASPIEIMNYFSAITDTNKDGERYNAGWSERWNPVIVRFFDCTERRPSSDEVFWCAACLNWVLARSGILGTCSSSSSSFRHNVGARTTNPAPGDVVVFRHRNKQLADAGRGHVGLFVSQTSAAITVLGGNQKRAGHYAVCEQIIDHSVPLVLDSFISIDSLEKINDPHKPCPCQPPVNPYLKPATHKK